MTTMAERVNSQEIGGMPPETRPVPPMPRAPRQIVPEYGSQASYSGYDGIDLDTIESHFEYISDNPDMTLPQQIQQIDKWVAEGIPAVKQRAEAVAQSSFQGVLRQNEVDRAAAKSEAEAIRSEGEEEAVTVSSEASRTAEAVRTRANSQIGDRTKEAEEYAEFIRSGKAPKLALERLQGDDPDSIIQGAHQFAAQHRAKAEERATSIISEASGKSQDIRDEAQRQATAVIKRAEEAITLATKRAVANLERRKAAIKEAADKAEEKARHDVAELRHRLADPAVALSLDSRNSIPLDVASVAEPPSRENPAKTVENRYNPQQQPVLKKFYRYLTATAEVRLGERLDKLQEERESHGQSHFNRRRALIVGAGAVGVFVGGTMVTSVIGPDKDSSSSESLADNIPDRYSEVPEWAPLSMKALQEEMARAAESPLVAVPQPEGKKPFNMVVGDGSDKQRGYQSTVYALGMMTSAGHQEAPGGVVTAVLRPDGEAAESPIEVPSISEVAEMIDISYDPKEPMDMEDSLVLGMRRVNEIYARLLSGNEEEISARYSLEADPDRKKLFTDLFNSWGGFTAAQVEYAVNLAVDWQKQNTESQAAATLLGEDNPAAVEAFARAAEVAEELGTLSESER